MVHHSGSHGLTSHGPGRASISLAHQNRTDMTTTSCASSAAWNLRRSAVCLSSCCTDQLWTYGLNWSSQGFAGQLIMIDAFAQCKQGSMVARPTRVGALTESPVALGSMLSIVWTAPTYWQSTRRWRNSMPRPGCMVETCAMVLLIVKTVLEIAEVMLTHGA